VTAAVFLCGVASARRAAIVTAAEAAFRIFVVVVMCCISVLGCCTRVAVRGDAGKGFLLAGLGVRSCGSGGLGGVMIAGVSLCAVWTVGGGARGGRASGVGEA